MDVERTDNFYPITTLTEDVEKIVLMKAALIAITDEHERNFLAVQVSNLKIFCYENCEQNKFLNMLIV